VHRGHQILIAAAVERARTIGVPATVLTFEPVPASVLRPDRFLGRISTVDEKLRHLGANCVDEVITVTFDLALAQQTPEAFMADVAGTGMIELWVGEAFALGRNRSGNVERLREIGLDLGFTVTAVDRLTDHAEVVSSSEIRKSILEGDVERAGRLLGRPFRVSGEVIHGAHLGRTIGYPTANLAPPSELVPLADGIYVSVLQLPGVATGLPSMTYIGTRPTVNTGERLIETHVFDFDADIYGEVIDVDVLARLRGDMVFSHVDELIEQLRQDEASARDYFAREQSAEN
jgi:riboflavin kinase/FMN adenylyltransferase